MKFGEEGLLFVRERKCEHCLGGILSGGIPLALPITDTYEKVRIRSGTRNAGVRGDLEAGT